MLAVIAYLAAIGTPACLLHRRGPGRWYWHALALAAAVGAGFVPIPPELQKQGFDLLLGCVLVAFFIWGAGGLLLTFLPIRTPTIRPSH